MLSGKHPAPDSPVVDHKVPHRGNPELFWSLANLQSVSKAYHDSVKQSMERGGQASSHPDWLRPSAIPLTIVCGAPASGKSTYVAQRAKPSHLAIDLDAIVADLSGGPTHGWDRDIWLNPAMFRRNDLIGSLSVPCQYTAAWLVVSEPKARFRQWWQDKVKPIEIVVIETSEAECIKRISSDPKRATKATIDGIVRWWAEYDPRRGETVVRGT
jgi:hypothetical protein